MHEISAVGTLVANESVMLRPEVAGRVAGIHFNEGQADAAGRGWIPAAYTLLTPMRRRVREAENTAALPVASE